MKDSIHAVPAMAKQLVLGLISCCCQFYIEKGISYKQDNNNEQNLNNNEQKSNLFLHV